MKDDFRRRCFFFPFAILAFVAVLTYVVYALWNGVVTDVLEVKSITYWQALGLLVLGKILFGGFPGGRGGCGGGPKEKFRRKMMEKKWATLDSTGREKFREEMRQRFGDWPRPPWCEPDDRKGPPSSSDSNA